MQPWKMFIRSVSVVTVLTAGGFAAGQVVVPFVQTSRYTAPSVSEDDSTATDAPAVDPAAEESTDSTTTTTTEAPKDEAADPVDDPAPTKPAVTPEESTTTTTSAPLDVLAAPKADPAPAVAPKPKDKKVKTGDHNCDTHMDNGWLKHKPANKVYPSGKKCPPASAPTSTAAPTAAPAPAAAPASAAAPTAVPANGDNGRSESAPGHMYQGDRPDGAPGRVDGAQNNRPVTGAPGQMKKSV